MNILILGSSLAGIKYIPAALSKLGYNPIFVVDFDSLSSDLVSILDSYQHYKIKINNINYIDRLIEYFKSYNLIGVMPFLDETIVHSCLIADKLDILGPDSSLISLVNKSNVQEYIPEHSPKSLCFSFDSIPTEKLEALLDASNTETLVIKPCLSSNSFGVFFIEKYQISKIKNIICKENLSNLQIEQWIAQPKIIGNLYSMEGFFRNGFLNCLGFCRKLFLDPRKSINEFPSDDTLPGFLQEECKKSIQELSDRSGFKNGYFHTEFIITQNKAYLIDANFGRIGGGLIVEQIALSFKKKPEEIIEHVFDMGLFQGKYFGEDFYFNAAFRRKTIRNVQGFVELIKN